MKKITKVVLFAVALLYVLLCISALASADATEIHVTSITIYDKTYNGNRYADVRRIITSPGLSRLGDVGVTFNAWYEDSEVGKDKAIHIFDINLTGSDAGKYTLVWDAPTIYYRDINPVNVYIAIAAADGKEYDGTTETRAVLVPGNIFQEEEDKVFLTGDAEFESADAGENKTVYISNIRLEGDEAVLSHYSLTTKSTTAKASIRKREIPVTNFSVADKIYDGSYTATVDVDYSGVLPDEDISVTAEGTYWDDDWSDFDATPGTRNVRIENVILSGTGKTQNYNLTVSAAEEIKAIILPKEVTVKGISALDKIEDGTVAATLDCSNVFIRGLLNNEQVGVNATGEFEDAVPGINKRVLINEIILTGNDATHYKLASTGQQTEAFATIIKNQSNEAKYFLPDGLKRIESQAFAGKTDMVVQISDSVLFIAEDAFDATTVVICPAGSYAETRCKELGLMVLVR